MCASELRDRQSAQHDSSENDTSSLPTFTKDWEDVSHFLVESDNLDALYTPVKASHRIKYSAMDVAHHYIALGTNTGALHVFSHNTLRYHSLAYSDTKEGSVILIAFSSTDDDVLALVTRSGVVSVIQLNIDKSGRAERLHTITDHSGSLITAICWSVDGESLYVGTDSGIVTRIFVQTAKSRKLLSLESTEFITQFDSAVVQIDTHSDLVLISTITAAYIANSSRKEFRKIGTKSRIGTFGACFYHGMSSGSVICCARPGSRLWTADRDGHVLSTLQLKFLLDRPSLNIVTLSSCINKIELGSAHGPQSLAFEKLHRISDNFLLTYGDQGLYIINPADVSIVLWSSSITDVLQLRCFANNIYFLLNDGSLRKVSLLSATQFYRTVYAYQHWELCTWMLKHLPHCQLSPCCLSDLSANLLRHGLIDLANEVDKLAAIRETSHVRDETKATCHHQLHACSVFHRLESGVYTRVQVPTTGELNSSQYMLACRPQGNEMDGNVESNASDSLGGEDVEHGNIITTVKNKLGSLKNGLIQKLSGPFVSEVDNPATANAVVDELVTGLEVSLLLVLSLPIGVIEISTG